MRRPTAKLPRILPKDQMTMTIDMSPTVAPTRSLRSRRVGPNRLQLIPYTRKERRRARERMRRCQG